MKYFYFLLLSLTSIVGFGQADFNYSCSEGKKVDIYGSSNCDGAGTINISVPTTSNIFKEVVEIVYKGGADPGSSVPFHAGGKNYTANKVTLSGSCSATYVYRKELFNPYSSVSHTSVSGSCTNNGGLQSVVVYAHRNVADFASSGVYTSVCGYCDDRNIYIPIDAGNAARDVEITLPISEITTDGRHMLITATACGVTKEYYLTSGNAGSYLHIAKFTMLNVPANCTSVQVNINTQAHTDRDATQACGQSYVISGAITANVECVDPCTSNLTVTNTGDCELDIYDWHPAPV